MGLQRRADRGDQVQPSGAPPRLKVRRGQDGQVEVEGPDREPTHPETIAEERPPEPSDPRSGHDRRIGGPFGA